MNSAVWFVLAVIVLVIIAPRTDIAKSDLVFGMLGNVLIVLILGFSSVIYVLDEIRVELKKSFWGKKNER